MISCYQCDGWIMSIAITAQREREIRVFHWHRFNPFLIRSQETFVHPHLSWKKRDSIGTNISIRLEKPDLFLRRSSSLSLSISQPSAVIYIDHIISGVRHVGEIGTFLPSNAFRNAEMLREDERFADVVYQRSRCINSSRKYNKEQ